MSTLKLRADWGRLLDGKWDNDTSSQNHLEGSIKHEVIMLKKHVDSIHTTLDTRKLTLSRIHETLESIACRQDKLEALIEGLKVSEGFVHKNNRKRQRCEPAGSSPSECRSVAVLSDPLQCPVFHDSYYGPNKELSYCAFHGSGMCDCVECEFYHVISKK
jgi:hypothetical protein